MQFTVNEVRRDDYSHSGLVCWSSVGYFGEKCPKMTTLNVSFCPRPTDIQLTVTEQERNQKIVTIEMQISLICGHFSPRNDSKIDYHKSTTNLLIVAAFNQILFGSNNIRKLWKNSTNSQDIQFTVTKFTFERRKSSEFEHFLKEKYSKMFNRLSKPVAINLIVDN